jgi:LysM repeat protein
MPKQEEPVAQAEPVEPAPAPMAESGVEPVETDSMQVDAVIDHLVYPDETLDEISRQYGVSKSDIMRLNNISDESSLREGQRLRIPISE